MKKSFKLLLVALGLVVIGFAMDAMVSYVPFSSSGQVKDVTIEPGSELSFQLNSRGEREIRGLFFSTPPNVPISMKVLNPDESILWETKSEKSNDRQILIPSFMNPNSKASLDVIISNLGDQKVIVFGGMHDVPRPTQDENDFGEVFDFHGDFIAYSILSGLLVFSGIIVGIIGVILFFKERKISLN